MLLTAALLAGCVSTVVQESSEPRIGVPADSIVLLPPGAGAVLGVVETKYVNATEQLISLTTRAKSPSQNYIRVQQFFGVSHSAKPGALQDIPLGNLDLAGEARGTVNFADMKQSPFFVQNTYGPFGYSMGRTATADLCMYAWQRIPEVKSPGGGVQRGSINIRMQYCDGQATEADLLQIMFQMRIRGIASTVIGSPAAIGQTGVLIAPTGGVFPGNVLPVVRPPVVASPAPAAAPRPTPVQQPTTPAPSGPSVPTPAPAPSGPQPVVPSPGQNSTPNQNEQAPPSIPSPTGAV